MEFTVSLILYAIFIVAIIGLVGWFINLFKSEPEQWPMERYLTDEELEELEKEEKSND